MAAVVFLVASVAGQGAATRTVPGNQPSAGRVATGEGGQAGIADQVEPDERLQVYGNRILTFSNEALRVEGLTKLIAAACRQKVDGVSYFLDRARAELLALQAVERDGARDSRVRVRLSDGKRLTPRASFLGTLLLAAAENCNREWASRLRRELSSLLEGLAEQAYATLVAGFQALATDREKAIGLVSDAMATGLSQQGSRGFYALVLFLNALARQDRTQADSLFHSAVVNLQQRPDATVSDWAHLGLYLFSSANAIHVPDAVEEIAVAGVSIVSLMAERTGMNPDLAKLYLRASIRYLNLSLYAPSVQHYALGVQLRTHTQRYVPDESANLEGILALISQGFPPQVKADVGNRLGGAPMTSVEDRVKAIESEPDTGTRDLRYTRLVALLVWQKRIGEARRVALQITDGDLQEEITRIVNYYEAASALERGSLEDVRMLMAKMPVSIERCLLFQALGLAAGSKDPANAFSWIMTSLEDLAQMEKTSALPFLRLSGAGVLARLNVEAAMPVLRQAFSDLNKEYLRKKEGAKDTPRDREGELFLGPGANVTRSIRGVNFVLNPPGVKLRDIGFAIAPMLAGNRKSIEELCLGLQDEELLVAALPALLSPPATARQVQ
jgi:hypothetical protein